MAGSAEITQLTERALEVQALLHEYDPVVGLAPSQTEAFQSLNRYAVSVIPHYEPIVITGRGLRKRFVEPYELRPYPAPQSGEDSQKPKKVGGSFEGFRIIDATRGTEKGIVTELCLGYAALNPDGGGYIAPLEYIEEVRTAHSTLEGTNLLAVVEEELTSRSPDMSRVAKAFYLGTASDLTLIACAAYMNRQMPPYRFLDAVFSDGSVAYDRNGKELMTVQESGYYPIKPGDRFGVMSTLESYRTLCVVSESSSSIMYIALCHDSGFEFKQP